jgi:hypothetical protein
MKQKNLIFNILILMLFGCSLSKPLPDFPPVPSRDPYEGFHWEIVEDNGIKFWAQRNETIHMIVNTGGEAGIVDDNCSKGTSFQMKIKVLPLPSQNIADLLSLLKQSPEWNTAITCAFRTVNSGRKGVQRYVLELSGPSAESFIKESEQEPIPSTCGGWGIGNSGMRYFEIHENHPDKAIFVEIGQEAPLFDEQSIVFSD